MRLPPIDSRQAEWPGSAIADWVKLKDKAASLESAAGHSDAFERMIQRFREMARTGRFDGLAPLLKRRMAARALTALWATDREYGLRLLSIRLLDALVDAQQPRLTRLTLVQLLQLYFGLFDNLDKHGKGLGDGLRQTLQHHIQDQLAKLPVRRHQVSRKDILSTLQENPWLLAEDAPLRLVQASRDEGHDFHQAINHFGLEGFDSGRYGDICRAHYYLATLSSLTPGEHDPVFDELLNSAVSKAPYQGEKRIGHAALEILIDRVADEPGEAWQNFIISLAGDPRIASSALAYREWWQPLGEERIAKVRGWLSREDLRLFLQAVEQYGLEENNRELQRMFPARKRFLEGLFQLKLIRNTRLVLGSRAEQSVRKILGSEVKTSFAKTDGQTSDRAIIYLDCNEFFIIQGSHNFKIWVYLAQPSERLSSYQSNYFSYRDLIHGIPGEYKKRYPGLPFNAITHRSQIWQNKVFSFLADNGISLDIEALLSPQDYRHQLQTYGMPAVNPHKTLVPSPLATVAATFAPNTTVYSSLNSELGRTAESSIPDTEREELPAFMRETLAQKNVNNIPDDERHASTPSSFARPAGRVAIPRSRLRQVDAAARLDFSALEPEAQSILKYFEDNPGDRVRFAASVLDTETRNINALLHGTLRRYVKQDSNHGWSLTDEGLELCREQGQPQGTTAVGSEMISRITGLTGAARRLLRRVASFPNSELSLMAEELGVRPIELEVILKGSLSDLCTERPHGIWSITPEAKAALDLYDQQESS